jgi:protein-L-isoaspartate O-methyltransferase
MSEAAVPPDFEAVKAKQKAAWSSGDYGLIANRVSIASEVLCDRADIVAGSRVLDVAGGAGYTAMAAARCGADVTSLDYVPELVARGREMPTPRASTTSTGSWATPRTCPLRMLPSTP